MEEEDQEDLQEGTSTQMIGNVYFVSMKIILNVIHVDNKSFLILRLFV